MRLKRGSPSINQTTTQPHPQHKSAQSHSGFKSRHNFKLCKLHSTSASSVLLLRLLNLPNERYISALIEYISIFFIKFLVYNKICLINLKDAISSLQKKFLKTINTAITIIKN